MRISAQQIGVDAGRGNLVAVQPFMRAADYATADTFHEKLAACFEPARLAGILNRQTIAVLPEYIGTWLVALGESRSVFRARTVSSAMKSVVLRQLPSFLGYFAVSRAADRTVDGIFHSKARVMAEAYQAVFSRLASRLGITIVAGSILLPLPIVRDGRIRPGRGPLQNVSGVFAPDGSIHSTLSRKCFPIQSERPFVEGASVSELPCFETPAGRLGVLVCADSWFPEAYEALREKRVVLIAVPSYVMGDDSWNTPWKWASVEPVPSDVDAADIGRIEEGAAWRKYALAGRIGLSGARHGVNVFLRGSLWDLGSAGRTTIVRNGAIHEALEPTGDTFLCAWL